MNDQNNILQSPSPTIPNKEIFEAASIQKNGPELNKKEIIKQHGGSGGTRFKLNTKWIFIILGLVILILLGAVIIKSLSGSKQSKEITLTWWGLQEDEASIRPLIEEYKQANPNVIINYQKQTAQDYRERLLNSLNQGKGPDIFQFHNSWVPMIRSNLSILNEDLTSTFYPVVSGDLKAKDGFYGIPLEIDGIALFVNNDILQSYGKSAPKTWDEFKSIANQLTIREQDGRIRQSGAAIGGTSNIEYWPDIFSLLMFQNGADLATPNSSSGVNAITFYTNFSRIDKVWNETLPNSQVSFVNGTTAMYFGKYSDIFKIRKQKPDLKFSVVPVPQLPTDLTTVPSVSYASYFVNGVASKSANKSEAWNFLKFMSSADSLKKLYEEEQKARGYGSIYPRVDMQEEIKGNIDAAPFVYEMQFARSFYLYGNTNDGQGGINSEMSAAYKQAIDNVNLSSSSQIESALSTAQSGVQQVLAKYGLVALPKATPKK